MRIDSPPEQCEYGCEKTPTGFVIKKACPLHGRIDYSRPTPAVVEQVYEQFQRAVSYIVALDDDPEFRCSIGAFEEWPESVAESDDIQKTDRPA